MLHGRVRACRRLCKPPARSPCLARVEPRLSRYLQLQMSIVKFFIRVKRINLAKNRGYQNFFGENFYSGTENAREQPDKCIEFNTRVRVLLNQAVFYRTNLPASTACFQISVRKNTGCICLQAFLSPAQRKYPFSLIPACSGHFRRHKKGRRFGPPFFGVILPVPVPAF